MKWFQKKHREVLEDTKPSDTSQTPVSEYFTGSSCSKYSLNDPRQIQINEALTLFIAGDLISLSVVESQNFKNLIEKLNPKYQVPSRKTLTTKLIHEKCSEMRNDIKHKLKSAQNICLTLDLWSNRQMRAFLGVTGHYIADWQMRSVMLAMFSFQRKTYRGCHPSRI